MDLGELRLTLTKCLSAQGNTPSNGSDSLDLVLANGSERWGFALCPEREEGTAFLGAFEAAMQRLIDARAADPQRSLGLALAFGSTSAGQHPSYRRALKKYSNSIVFEDLGISLYLVKGENDILVLAPAEVNEYLRGLDRHVASSTK